MDTIIESKLPLVFEITGMDCADCAKTLENGIRRLSGVEHCELNFTTGRMRVRGNASREAIIQQVRKLGYDVAKQEEQPTSSNPETFWHYLKEPT